MNGLDKTGLSRTIDNIFSYFAKKSHKHSKSDITDFPTSMLANGGNASTVNGHTVNSNVPANAKLSTKPSYTASEVGAVNAVIKTETDYNKITPDSNTVYFVK